MPAGNIFESASQAPTPDSLAFAVRQTTNHVHCWILKWIRVENSRLRALFLVNLSGMKERSPKNSVRPISKSRWLAYAAAVSATAFGTAAAEAEIHYSGVVDKKLVNPHGGTSARFRLSNGAYISLYNISYGRRGYNYAGFRLRGAAVSHGFRASAGPPYFGVGASRLHSGEPVSQGIFRATYPSSTVGNIRSFYGGGNWDAGGRGFIGFKFNTGAGPQYGWVRIKISPPNFV